MRSKPDKPLLLWTARIIICVAAIAFIVIGISRGEVSIILKKAVNICLECIGLG